MATATIGTSRVRRRRCTGMAFLIATAALLAPPIASFASAQTADMPVPRPLKARDAFASAQQSYRQGDYQAAAQLYQDADANKHQLTPAEQTDLAALIKNNTTALQASRDGAIHLKQAKEALQQNKLQEASALIKAESANQYLQPADKARLTQLTEELRKLSGGGSAVASSKAAAIADTGKDDYRTLVNLARASFQQGDYDNAEKFGKQAEKKAGVMPSMPWNDSHSKVLRDVQTERAKLAATVLDNQQPAGKDGKPEQPSLLTKGMNKVTAFLSPGSAQPNKDVQLPVNPEKNVVAGPAVNGPTPQLQHVVSKETLDARMLRQSAIDAIQRDDLKSAKTVLLQAAPPISVSPSLPMPT